MAGRRAQLRQMIFKVSEVERLTGWSRMKIYELLQTGELTGKQDAKGKPWQVRRVDLEKFLGHDLEGA